MKTCYAAHHLSHIRHISRLIHFWDRPSRASQIQILLTFSWYRSACHWRMVAWDVCLCSRFPPSAVSKLHLEEDILSSCVCSDSTNLQTYCFSGYPSWFSIIMLFYCTTPTLIKRQELAFQLNVHFVNFFSNPSKPFATNGKVIMIIIIIMCISKVSWCNL